LLHAFWKSYVAPEIESAQEEQHRQDVASVVSVLKQVGFSSNSGAASVSHFDASSEEAATFYSYSRATAFLSMVGRVVPDRYWGDDTAKLPASKLEEVLRQLPEARSVRTIDVSYNSLCDENMCHVLAGVQALTECGVVILRGNRFLGREQPFKDQLDVSLIKLLSLRRVMFVDIALNGAATFDRKDLYETIDEDLLPKLIFVPRRAVMSDGWGLLLKSRKNASECIAAVRLAHRNYYDMVLTQLLPSDRIPAWARS
jgi:hypothetical protein